MQVQELSVNELRAALEEGRPLTVLDVRPTAQRAEWAIPDSRHVDAYDELWRGESAALCEAAGRLPRDRPVVAVCAMGRTSLIAAEILQQLGFDAYSLAGGMTAWSEAWNTATATFPGDPAVTVVQVRRTGKGCLSYVVGSGSEAVVIDPSVDAGVYLHVAGEHGWRIVAVLDTHVHADHVSRARALAQQAGAALYLPPQNRVTFEFQPLEDGSPVRFGGSTLRAVQTAGHTTESMSYVVNDQAVFTGDTLFLQSVGRPDLVAPGDEPTRRARMLFRSLKDRLAALPGSMQVFPCHTSEPVPFDGVVHAARLDRVLAGIPLLALDEEPFVQAVLERIPPTPPNHVQIVRINEGKSPMPADMRPLEAGANRCAVSR
ncbi:MAG: MBL fold metallo-hydrolase [Acidobacteriota bacterium]|nr:MBL fold metallo-hydrolase [Acidobacteriota bacterium]